MAWIKAVLNFFAGLFSRQTAEAFVSGIRAAAPYIRAALEFSEAAASICGGPVGRTVTTVAQLADKLGVMMILKDDLTVPQLGEAIREVIFRALQEKYPDAEARRLNRAIEVAYGKVNP
jgi:hypothetical protein